MSGLSRRARAASLLPVLAWYGVIWRFSSQTAAASGSLSDRLLYRLLELCSPAFAASPESVRAAVVELLSFFERKAAHMFLYFVLALLAYFAASCLLRRLSARAGAAAALCALLASLDEYHQTLVPGRSGEARDMLVDLCGALIALGFLALPHAAAWCRRSLGVPLLPALVPAAVCLICLCLALRPPEAHAASPLTRWAAARFVPEAAGLAPGELAEFLTALAPALRDVLFLTACGAAGVCVPMAGLLAGARREAVYGAFCAAVLGAAGLAGGAALPPLPAGMLAALGALGMGALWWIAASLAAAKQKP